MSFGSGFGAAMSGLSSGLSIGKAVQGAGLLGGKSASTAQSGDKVGFGLGRSLVSGDAGSSEIATPATENTGWGALSKIMESLTGGSPSSGAEGQDQALAGAGLGILKKITG